MSLATQPKTHVVRGPYSPKNRVSISQFGLSRTKQGHKAETDINTIMAKFQTTGMIDFVNKHEPQYGDASAVDFQTSMETVASATEMFADLPAKVRDRFNNNPQELLLFLDNPENKAEAVLLGLAKPEPQNTPATTNAGKERLRRASDEPEAKSSDTAKA